MITVQPCRLRLAESLDLEGQKQKKAELCVFFEFESFFKALHSDVIARHPDTAKGPQSGH
ncbi:hypothetical protein [Pseudomonas synxantha]|uniref:hypothetical protein n=1 Tax=Pseudomonas synxantha TaxID=47883 RepID=UPI0006147C2B|nr:hypothetical protein [Pseudomonas synxantha]